MRTEIPSLPAAWVRLPEDCSKAWTIASRSSSSIVSPVGNSLVASAASGAGEDPVGKIALGHDVAIGQHQHAFQRVSQFADVSRPAVNQKAVDDLARNAPAGGVLVLADLFQEIVHKDGNVVGPVAKGRQADRDDIQPVEQILAESSLLHHLANVAAGGSQQRGH